MFCEDTCKLATLINWVRAPPRLPPSEKTCVHLQQCGELTAHFSSYLQLINWGQGPLGEASGTGQQNHGIRTQPFDPMQDSLVSHLCPRVLCWAGEDSSHICLCLIGPLLQSWVLPIFSIVVTLVKLFALPTPIPSAWFLEASIPYLDLNSFCDRIRVNSKKVKKRNSPKWPQCI